LKGFVFLETGFRVYFVDFGNEEVVSVNRLTECPEVLRNIPWQSVQIKLANIKLTDDERYVLLRDFETDRLEMKIIQKNQDVYLVDLINNGKSIVEHILELRKKQQSQITTINNEVCQDFDRKTNSIFDLRYRKYLLNRFNNL
jgi:hypothetical protein